MAACGKDGEESKRETETMRTIKTTPGLGDSAWVLLKVINAREKFNWFIHDAPPQRGKQIFDLLPMVGTCQYAPGLGYNLIKSRSVTRMARTWGRIRAQSFFLEANSHLEAGRRIEEFLPDLPTSYHLPFQTTPWQWQVKIDMHKETHTLMYNSPLIGIYASSYGTSRNWSFWTENEWFDLIEMMHRMIPEAKFVIIGAEWDTDLASNLMAKLLAAVIPFINTIGQPLGYVIELMKILDYAFYFPSGLGIISGLLSRPSTMFYSPSAHPRLMRTWADPELIKSGIFTERFFCSPGEAFEHVRDNYKLATKI
jgi:hypothetical protein